VRRTHDLVDRGWLTKRYVSWLRGEHEREWTVLRRVHAHCPDLVPGSPARLPVPFFPGSVYARPPPTVLGHAHPNLANYLWDEHRIRIVDFEDAGRSDSEFELADLVEHLAARFTDWTPFLTIFDLISTDCCRCGSWRVRVMISSSRAGGGSDR
jgi:hypothetical protein